MRWVWYVAFFAGIVGLAVLTALTSPWVVVGVADWQITNDLLWRPLAERVAFLRWRRRYGVIDRGRATGLGSTGRVPGVPGGAVTCRRASHPGVATALSCSGRLQGRRT